MELVRSSSSYRLSNLDTIEPGEIIAANKEEEWITEKKKTNHKIRNVQTKVQRHLVLEDGVVIADSGTHVSTHTDEQNESEDTDEETQRDYRIKESDELRRLRSDPTFEELPLQQQVIEQRVSSSRLSRQRRQEHFRFEDDEVGELDGDRVHRLAVEDPSRLLQEARSSDVLADEPAVIRGRLMHYESKGLRQTDCLETKEKDRIDEIGRKITEKIQHHEHEEIDEDELPQRLYDNDRYVEELKQVAGNNFKQIPPAEYSADAVRLPYSNDRLTSTPALPAPARGRIEEYDKYEMHDSLQEHRQRRYGGEHVTRELHRPTGRTITFNSSNDRRKEDAGVQACFLSDDSDSESEVEVKVQRGILRSPSPRAPTPNKSIHFEEPVRPTRVYYFGEKESLKPIESPITSDWSNTKFNSINEFNDSKYKSSFAEDFNNNNYSFKDLNLDSNKNYAYQIADQERSYSGLDPLPPLGIVSQSKRAFEPNTSFSSDLDIPLRRNWADKTPPSRPFTDFGHYRSNSNFRLTSTERPSAYSASTDALPVRTTSRSSFNAPINTSEPKSNLLRASSSSMGTKWPEFSPLSSPSELLSAATLKRSTRNASTNYSGQLD